MRFNRPLHLAAAALCAVGMGIRTQAATTTLRQGTNGYSGFTDVSVDVASRFESDPDDGQLTIRSGDFYREGFILIRADLSSMPPSAGVREATLRLWGASGEPVTLSAHQVLKSWSAGQVNWVDRGDGQTWSTPGMKAAIDYSAVPLDTVSTTATDAGGYHFDITEAVQRWLREPSENFGIVLLGRWDAWRIGPTRALVSSESSDADRRPSLTIAFEPEAPVADAGEDQRGGPGTEVSLDASGSGNATGDSDGLSFSWRIIDKPPASTLGEDLGQDRTARFFPDLAGRYVVELTVTDKDGQAAVDTVTIRPDVAKTRPRLWIDTESLPLLKEKIAAEPEAWRLVTAKCADESTEASAFFARKDWRGPVKMSGLANCALNYLLTGDERQGREAVAIMMDNCDKGTDLLAYADGKVGAVHAGAVALGYDWCYDLLSPEQRRRIIAQLNDWAEWCMTRGRDNDEPSSNYFHRYLWVTAAAALATYHENDQAERLLRYAREYMLETLAEPWLTEHGAGGDWPEGNGSYDGPLFLAYTLAALKTATGEDLFKELPFFKDSVLYHLYVTLPAVSGDVTPPAGRDDPELIKGFYKKGPCLMYPSGEYPPDGYGVAIPGLYQYPEHTRYMTIASWALQGQQDEAALARWWLDNTPGTAGHCAWSGAARSQPLTAVVQFIFAPVGVRPASPQSLDSFYHCPGTGFVTWRSSWDRDATFFAFECGPRLSANQGRSANGIFIYKRGYLIGHVPNVRLETNNSVSMTIDGMGQTTMPRDSEPRLLAATDAAEYLYVAGDAAGAYNSSFFGRRLCESFTRQVVVIKPGLFVIFDRATPVDPNSSCQFLCFFGDRPVAGKDSLYAESLGGEISSEPADMFVSKTIWDAKAYLQLPLETKPSVETFPQLTHAPQIRLAFTPRDGGRSQDLLAVIYVPQMSAAEHPQVRGLRDADSCGIEGRWAGRSFRINFNRQGEPGGRIVIETDGAKLVDSDLR